jgi:hypothetical protein
MKNILLVPLVVCLLSVVGCGPRTVTVSGKIVFDGEPGQNINVLFQGKSDGSIVPEAAVGKTDSAGVYSLSLVSTKKRGAFPGDYAVYLSWLDPNPDTSVDIEAPGYKSVDRSPYKIPTRAKTGGIIFTVPPTGTKEANFEFDSTTEPRESFAPPGV